MKREPNEQELLDILVRNSVCRGNFTLASGAQSDLYIDARLTTLDPRGARLIGQVGWTLIKENRPYLASEIDAVGGLTMGADPIALSIALGRAFGYSIHRPPGVRRAQERQGARAAEIDRG